MMVIFVSQCEKKALNRTRRVLDAFADRIGDNTWQTVITEEGLQAVKKLLRQTASKSTAVSCHWIRSRARSDLLWVVGNKRQFDYRGVVAVNRTEGDVSKFMDKKKWKTLPIIKYASAIAGLFHDFGKATVLFQNKLNPSIKTEKFEPFKHEWVSMRLFQAFVQDKTDEQWLNEFSNGEFDFDGCCQDDVNPENNPLTTLAPFAKLIAWLILTHHKLPKYPENWEGDFTNNPVFEDIDHWLSGSFCAIWNSPKSVDVNQQSRIPDNWKIVDAGLPINSFQWKAKASLMASDALRVLAQIQITSENWIIDEVFISHISRMALMLADHYFSSFSYEKTRDLGLKSKNYPVYANTYKKTDDSIAYKQQLDEHLIGVADNAVRIVEMLPEFVKNAQGLQNKSLLEDKVDKDTQAKFGWQDNAKSNAQKLAENTLKNGF